MSDNRDSPRRSVSVPATIVSGHARASGVVIDISRTGAKLRLDGAVFVGRECTLDTRLLPEPVASRIVWRRGQEIGVKFRTPVMLSQPAMRAGAFLGAMFGRR